MITASVARNAEGHVVSFTVNHHGDSHVCAAVSMLVLNTVNSVEALTQADFTLDCDETRGGFLSFALQTARSEAAGHDAGLLIDAMVLGLETVAANHPGELTMKAG